MRTKSFSVKAILFAVAMLTLSVSAMAQSKKISGTVKGEDGEPLAGVTVMIKGTTTGVATGIDGTYSLNYSQSNAVAEYSCIGYVTQDITIGNQTVINVVLAEDTQQIEETVVVGYAVGNKRTVTGSVERVTAENMNTGYVSNPIDAIRGKVPGLVITSDGGNVTDEPTIRIRGTSSLSGGNTPLVIIDGIFGDISMLYSMSPEDIQEITVLKDASETAQYGSRGAAGVIVVTTYKGKEGTAFVDYRGQIGISTAYKTLEMLSSDEYRDVNRNMFGGAGLDMGYDTNWMDWIQNKASIQNNHNISITQGTKKGSMRASLGIQDRQGVIRNTDHTNYVARLSAQQKALNDKLLLEVSLMGSYRTMNFVDRGVFAGAATYNPTFPHERNAETGWWDYDPNAETVTHPGDYFDYTRLDVVARAVASARATYTIVDGLSLSVFGSYNYNNKLARCYYPYDTKDYRVKRGEADVMTTLNESSLVSAQLNYNKTIGKHAISALALAEAQTYTYFYSKAASAGFDTNYFLYNNLQAGSTVKYGDVASDANQYRILSYMARFNYMFDDRYVITVNARTDGSSKLGANHKWGFFPSASAAWLVSNEGFMKNQKTISNLKVRVGYGVTGNQDAISPYRSLKVMSPNGTTSYNGSSVVTYALASNPNPDLQWETKYTFDAGIDFGLWKNRFSGTLDVYTSTTKNLLYTYTVPVPPFAYSTLLANMGTMKNNGVELALRGAVIEKKDWGLTLGGNMAFQKNELVSLAGTYQGQDLTTAKYIATASASCNGLTSNTNVVYMTEGYPINIFRLPVHDGFNEDATGKKTYKVKDVNGDGGITLDDEGDREYLGQATPKVVASLNAQLRFKNWDLSTQMNGAFGHMIYNFSGLRLSSLGSFPTYNVLKTAPELGVYNAQHTSYWLEHGDYVNIEYITLGYNLPAKKLGLKNLQSLRVAASCNNVATITGYSGLTPMINSMTLGGGIDNNIFPVMRTWTLQLTLRF